MPVFFGDLHTHSTFSDGNMEPPEVLARARSHLDFYGPDGITRSSRTRLRGGPDVFHGWRAIVQPINERWAEVQALIKRSHEPRTFVTFLVHEWSSMQCGDHNVYYFNDDEPIRHARSLAELYALLRGVEAIAIPHHTAWPPLQRGYNWEASTRGVAPLWKYSLPW